MGMGVGIEREVGGRDSVEPFMVDLDVVKGTEGSPYIRGSCMRQIDNMDERGCGVDV